MEHHMRVSKPEDCVLLQDTVGEFWTVSRNDAANSNAHLNLIINEPVPLLQEHVKTTWCQTWYQPEFTSKSSVTLHIEQVSCRLLWSTVMDMKLTTCRHVYEGVFKRFRIELITKYTLTTINTRWEATQSVMAAKLIRLTHKIAIQLHPGAESCTICRSRSRPPVRKLLDIPSYTLRTGFLRDGFSVLIPTTHTQK
jgi:hypothetical protein